MEIRRDVYQAIADPTRRQIMNLLFLQSLNVNAIAEKFNISRPAVSKHVKILAECGLINFVVLGRERKCQASFMKLKEVSVWIDQYKSFWNYKLDALEEMIKK